MASSARLSVLVGVFLITCFAAAQEEPYVPALYVFGDSLADAGNNNYIPNCTARADYIPYGASYFPYPTGRFTDGRTTFDFVANCLGLPFCPPYLQPDANFTTGINFASAGSGLLDDTGANQNVMSVSQQVSLFEEYSANLSEAEQAKLGSSLFGIVAGSNDVPSFFTLHINNGTSLADFGDLLLSRLDNYITRLYNGGARKFIVVNIPPLQCTPTVRLLLNPIDYGRCSWLLNQVIKTYNTNFSPYLTQLGEKLKEATIIQLNVYDYIMNVIDNGEFYGLRNTTWACCGSGLFGTEIWCGNTEPPDLFCDDASEYVFWDGIHGTEKTYSLFSEQIWSGNTSVAYPFNLSTLVSGETCLNVNNAPTLPSVM